MFCLIYLALRTIGVINLKLWLFCPTLVYIYQRFLIGVGYVGLRYHWAIVDWVKPRSMVRCSLQWGIWRSGVWFHQT